MYYPVFRPRRLRETETFRRMVRETLLTTNDFIMPFFAVHGRAVRREISSMPGNFQLSVEELVKEVKETAALGIPGIILFGLPAAKDAMGSEAYAKDGIVQRAVRAIKDPCRTLW
jgi:porphobilinogen synthase